MLLPFDCLTVSRHPDADSLYVEVGFPSCRSPQSGLLDQLIIPTRTPAEN
jgi:hypothetical protein